MHANGASMFFIVVYAHIGRGLYYGSYMAPRQLLWCSGVVILLLMMGTAFTGARVGHVEGLIRTFTQNTLVSIIFNLIFGSLWRGWVVTRRFLIFLLNSQQWGLKRTIGRGVKGYVRVSKTSKNCLKAQICIVSESILVFLNCWINKRSCIHVTAIHCITFVHSKYRSTSTYTINSNFRAVKGEV